MKPAILEPLKDLVYEFKETTWIKENIHDVIEKICKKHQIGFGKIGQPLRVAVTGNTVSPPIDVTLALLEKEVVALRLKTAIEYIEKRVLNSS